MVLFGQTVNTSWFRFPTLIAFTAKGALLLLNAFAFPPLQSYLYVKKYLRAITPPR